MTEERSLEVYLNDHLTAATSGVELFRRAARSHPGERGEELARLRDEAVADRETLRSIMRRLGVAPNLPLVALGWVGEKAGRLKPNGYVVRRSPLADVIELEGLRLGAQGRLACWQVLRAVATHDIRLTVLEMDELVGRAEDQAARLYKLHLQVAQEKLAG